MTGLRRAAENLEDALAELQYTNMAMAGWRWEVWFVPTEQGVESFKWEYRQVGGSYTDENEASLAWYMEHCDYRAGDPNFEYGGYELIEISPDGERRKRA